MTMNETRLEGVGDLVSRGETQQVEFKHFEKLDGHEKNILCCEIAAMANSGGGHLLLGVEDGPPPIVTGIDPRHVGTLVEVGWLQKLLRTRMAPQPDLDVYAIPIEGTDRSVVVVEVEAPHQTRQPVFWPIILTKDVQNEKGRVKYAKGTVLMREHTECAVVLEERQWARVMNPILDRYREHQMRPLLRAMITQDMVSGSAKSRMQDFAERIPDFEALTQTLQEIEPNAARYDTRMILDGVEHFSYAHIEELVEATSVMHRGWAYPTYHHKWLTRDDRGRLEHRFHGEKEPPSFFSSYKETYQEFWLFTPDGAFGSSMLDRIDLHPDFNGAVPRPPGPDRLLDTMVVVWHVVEFIEFVRKIAEASGASRVWASFVLDNVLNRPVRYPSMKGLQDRMGGFGFGRSVSNQRTISIEGEFDVDLLKVEWREVAVRWGLHVLTRLGVEISEDGVREAQDGLLHLENSWNRGPVSSG